MIGRETSMNQCIPTNTNKEAEERYKRCIFADMKIAIDLLKEFDDKLKVLHPDIIYRVRQLI